MKRWLHLLSEIMIASNFFSEFKLFTGQKNASLPLVWGWPALILEVSLLSFVAEFLSEMAHKILKIVEL